jgi:aryl-alcohol dehydrogenase-like predicted oxidoreductase
LNIALHDKVIYILDKMTAVIRGLPASLQKSLNATKVEYVRLGNSGLHISWPILGAMSMGSSPYATWLINREESLKVLKAAYDNGINTWDTSCVYSNGQSEEILGAAIRELNIPRQKVVIMTKCGFAVGEDDTVLGHGYAEFMNQSKDYVNHGGRIFAMK